jgi:hypothetical protein
MEIYIFNELIFIFCIYLIFNCIFFATDPFHPDINRLLHTGTWARATLIEGLHQIFHKRWIN